jgi:hypothetical protein
MGKFFIAIIAISIALVLGTALLVTYFLVRGLIQFCSLRTNRRARNPGPTSLKDAMAAVAGIAGLSRILMSA